MQLSVSLQHINTYYINFILTSNMIDEILEQDVQKKQSATTKTILSAKSQSTFIPARFSVKRLRKHPGIQANRNPIVIS